MLDGDVHIWRVPLAVGPLDDHPMLQSLSPNERRRAHSFMCSRVRQRFVVSHFALRDILGKYLNKPGSEVEFDIQDRGKPVLTPAEKSKICFNLSHSGDLALVAITKQSMVGVDIEKIREISRIDQLVVRFFEAQEITTLSNCAPEEKLLRFFELWTKKEAYLKGMGDGLMGSLDTFGRCSSDWNICTLDVESGYCGALAIQGPQIAISYFDWSQKNPKEKELPRISQNQNLETI